MEGNPSAYHAPAGLRIGHIHLRVTDLGRSVAFYRDVMGFDLLADLGTVAFLSVGGYHHHIALNTWHSKGGAPAPA
ncbi:VOC family protein, partial [Flaviaesturariibacter aridisoli]